MSDNSFPSFASIEDFIVEIKEEVQLTTGLTMTINDKAVKVLMKRARRKFYKDYDGAVTTQYIVIEKSSFSTPLYKNKRQIQLPDCISAVYFAQEGSSFGLGFGSYVDKDLQNAKFRIGSAVLGSSQDLVYGLAMQYYNSFVNDLDLKNIPIEFDSKTGIITVVGRDPYQKLICQVAMNIPLLALTKDETFYNFILGSAYKLLATPLSLFKFNLIGNSDINTSELTSMGDELLSGVEDDFDEQADDASFWIEGDRNIG